MIDPNKVMLCEKFMEYELGMYTDMSAYDKLNTTRNGGKIPMSAFDRMENSKVRETQN